MDKQEKHNSTSLEKFLNYIKGLLSKKEQHSFEKEMMRDPFAEEAWEGISQLESKELEQDLADIGTRIQARSRKKRMLIAPVYRYAAAAILVLALGTTIYLIRQSVKEAPMMFELSEISDSLIPSKATAPLPKDTAKQEIAEARPKVAEQALAKQEVTEAAELQEFEKQYDEMEEVAVTGYGSQKKESVTGANITSNDALTAEPIQSIPLDESPQGRAAGVKVLTPSERTSEDLDAGMARVAENTMRTMTSPVKEKDGARIIEGLVYSTDGDPLPGVNVMLKGTTTGTISDMNGEFTLEVPAEYEGSLVFNYLGFVQEEVELENQDNISLALTEDVAALEEVVVIGYGTQKKRDETGSISEVDMDNIIPGATDVSQHTPAKPKDGNLALRRYIQENINYNNLPDFTEKVIVKLSFTISESGYLGPIKVEESGGEAFDKEAIRLIQDGPAWQAGTIDGSPVSDEVILRIKFKPQGE